MSVAAMLPKSAAAASTSLSSAASATAADISKPLLRGNNAERHAGMDGETNELRDDRR